MKPEESIEKLNILKKLNIPILIESYEESFREACETAITFLEKQIPQKPVIKDDVYENYTSEPIQAYVCPSCGEVLIAIKTKELLKLNLFFVKPKFCQECGQAIEWE